MENSAFVQAQDTDADIRDKMVQKEICFFNQMLRRKEEMQNEFYGRI